MNRFNERHGQLIYYLFNKQSWCSFGELCKSTGVPRSTMWRDLNFIQSVLPTGWSIERNELQGVRLIKPIKGTLECVWTHLKRKNTYFQIVELIILENGVSINNIVEKVHISRSTFYRQLEKIEEVIESAGIHLEKNPYRLQGDEKKIRRFIMQYLEFKIMNTSDLDNFDGEAFKSSLLQQLSDSSVSLHIGALHRLTMIMYIANIRIGHGCYVSFPAQILKEYQESKYFRIAKNLFPFMAKCPTRNIQMKEILFFTLYLLVEEEPLNRTKHLGYIRSQYKRGKGDSISNSLSELSAYTNIDLFQDDKFLYKYVQTIRRITFDSQFNTDTRVNNMLPFLPYVEKNPLFKFIEGMKIKSFSTASFCLGKLEVLEIFLLVQAALLRKKNQTIIKTALICRTYIEKEYISEVLRFHFGQQLRITSLDIADSEILQRNNEYDLIISTIGNGLFITHIPNLKVSSFPSSAELIEIRQFINQYFIERWEIDERLIYPFEGNY
ncbi:helix-turn-helix domain-containing protein [Lysinibacillus fusiformis]|uniref:helix-turn-helix domain-containing protein n=1 Tax=Lysinibacillus fusiformis TaxID=28031 RepID=UPI00381653E7